MMKLILLVIALAAIFFLTIRYIERKSIFFPMKGLAATPLEVNLPYEDVYFETSDKKRLNGWFVPCENAKGTILFCHGNAGNIGHRLEKIVIFHGMGLNTFIFDYRGYGKSEGRPNEAGLYKDAFAAYDYLTGKLRVPAGDIILYGESIGGGVTIELAREKKVKALITEDTFSSIKEMSSMVYPFIPHFAFSSRFDSISKIKNIDSPKLIIHSRDDEIVPYSMGEKLYAAAKPPKKFLKIRGAHNTAFLDSEKEYTEGIRSFIDNL